MYKRIVISIVALLALAVQVATGIAISEDLQIQVATAVGDLIAVGIVVYGIIKGTDLIQSDGTKIKQ